MRIWRFNDVVALVPLGLGHHDKRQLGHLLEDVHADSLVELW